jgi:hypothetical protein
MEIDKSTLETLKGVGKKNQTYDQLIRQRIRCNATGCEAIGSIETQIQAESFQNITLFVCPSCVGKFQNDH